MANLVFGLNITQAPDGKMSIRNTTSGITNESFDLEVILHSSKGDSHQVVIEIENGMGWTVDLKQDGWYEFKLLQYEDDEAEEPENIYCQSRFSMVFSYICLNSMLLKLECGCDIDLNQWVKVYSKITAIKAAANQCMYSHAQCMVENLQKICKGC